MLDICTEKSEYFVVLLNPKYLHSNSSRTLHTRSFTGNVPESRNVPNAARTKRL